MPQTIAVLNPKGGAGKTTLAIHLARGLQLYARGAEPTEEAVVAVIDADAEQMSAATWAERQPEGYHLPVTTAARPGIEKFIRLLGRAVDYVVIDGGAKLERMDADAIKAADLVLIPVQPSALDIWPLEGLVELIRARQEITGRPAAAFVVTQQNPATIEAREVDEALAALGLPVLRARLGERVAFRRTIGDGLTVLDGAHGAATGEAVALTAEVLDLLSAEGRREAEAWR